MTTSTHSPERLTWTVLGARMGYTSEQPQREEILDAIERMNWTQLSRRVTALQHPSVRPLLRGSAVRAIITAVFHRNRADLRLIGVAQLNGGRQLIGVEDRSGTRRYLLDLDSEAIHVLAEFSHPLTSNADTAHVA